jgi:hypothetical protein
VRKISFAVVAVTAILSGCASSPKMGNVIPQSGGKYEVVTTGPSNDEALQSGLFSAETTCKERKMRHVISSQSTAYKGMVSEDSNKTMDKAAQILTAVTGAWIPTLSSDDDYQVKLGFTCEL